MLPVLLQDHVKTSCALIKLKPKEFQKPLPFFFFFFLSFKIAINEKGDTTTVSMMTIMTIISPFDRPRSHSGVFYHRNLQSQCTVYLPVQLTPKYSDLLQIHRKDPLVLWHVEPLSQLCLFVAHSLTSAKQEVLLFSLSFF